MNHKLLLLEKCQCPLKQQQQQPNLLVSSKLG
jgi:hypothetical protein